MHKKFIFPSIIFLCLVCFVGCANLKTRKITGYVPSLIDEELDLNIGIELLLDRRPAVDKKFTADIEKVPEEVTDKLLEYFKATSPLREIHYPSQEDDDIVIQGEIRRFMWRSYSKAATYIPLVNLYVYLGIPCKTAYGLTHISLILKDNKTGKIIGRFDEYSKVAKSYSLYEFRKIDFASELEQSFKEVASKLKRKIIFKIRILNLRYQRSKSN